MMIKIFIVIITLYLFFYCFAYKQDYINVSQVIKKQILSILRIKKERRKSDIKSFINIYIIPLLLAFLISLENIISEKFYDNIILILAILVSVFLTLISILTSKSYKTKTEKQKEIINLTYNNVYFLTITSILLLIFCFIKISFLNFNLNIIENYKIISSILLLISNNLELIFNTIILYLIIEIIIHLLIVLKRIEQIFFITFED